MLSGCACGFRRTACGARQRGKASKCYPVPVAATTAAPEPPVDAIYRAWRAAQVDPDLAHEAVEQVRAQAGRNVIDVMESRFEVIESRFEVMESRFDELKAEIRILQRVIWPLIGILATTVFGLLYQTVAP